MNEGILDYGSGRYRLIGRSNQVDYSFHAGDTFEFWTGYRWASIRMEADLEGHWYFVDDRGRTVSLHLGMKARLKQSFS